VSKKKLHTFVCRILVVIISYSQLLLEVKWVGPLWRYSIRLSSIARGRDFPHPHLSRPVLSFTI